MVKYTVATILKNKAIKAADIVIDVKKELNQSTAVQEIEKLLL